MVIQAPTFAFAGPRRIASALAETPTQISDSQLVHQVQQGRTGALEQLYDRYATRALGLAFKVLQDRAAAEEVAQDAFWRVWKHAGEYQPERSSFSTWLFAIVRNLAIDQLRRRKRHVEFDDEQGEYAAESVPTVTAAEIVDRRLESQEIRAALGQLPEAQRRVIEMAYFEGYTHHEIAERMGTPIGTVHTRARLGLEKLRQLLQDQVEGQLAAA